MTTLMAYRQMCLRQQTELRQLMYAPEQYERAMQLFMRQHAMLHSAEIAGSETWSYADEIFKDINEEHIRRVLPKREHSIAWLIWHMARCEDITMNLLVAGRPQVLSQLGWLERLNTSICDTGNAMTRDEVVSFSQGIDIAVLRAYRLAVGRQTRVIAQQLDPEALRRKVDLARLARVSEEGAVVEAARSLIDYWGRRDVAGLLLMPATRHNLVHLNEALGLSGTRS